MALPFNPATEIHPWARTPWWLIGEMHPDRHAAVADAWITLRGCFPGFARMLAPLSGEPTARRLS